MYEYKNIHSYSHIYFDSNPKSFASISAFEKMQQDIRNQP